MSDTVLENDVKARLLSVAHDLQTRRAGSSRDFLFKDHIAIGGGRENQLEGKSLLYGSNRSAGDFQIWGHATRNCNGTVSFAVRYEWNDIIDPNYKHGIDRWLAPIFLNAGAKNYAITIFWHQPTATWEYPGRGHPSRGLDSGWPFRPVQ